MGKRNLHLPVKTDSEVMDRLNKIRSDIKVFPPTRSTLAHQLLDYASQRVVEGKVSIQRICGAPGVPVEKGGAN